MDKINFKGIIMGILTSVLITVFLLIIMSAVFYFSDIPEGMMKYFSYAALFIGVFVGGFLLSKNSDSGKGVSGILLGVLVFAVLLLINLGFGNDISSGIIVKLVICLLAALIGTVAGG